MRTCKVHSCGGEIRPPFHRFEETLPGRFELPQREMSGPLIVYCKRREGLGVDERIHERQGAASFGHPFEEFALRKESLFRDLIRRFKIARQAERRTGLVEAPGAEVRGAFRQGRWDRRRVRLSAVRL